MEAADGADTLDALRRELHVSGHGSRPDVGHLRALGSHRIRERGLAPATFGSVALGDAALSEDGRHVGLPPEQIDDDPSDTVLFETIRRCKRLDAPIIVLVELPYDEHARGRLDALLYVALTRATTSLTVIRHAERHHVSRDSQSTGWHPAMRRALPGEFGAKGAFEIGEVSQELVLDVRPSALILVAALARPCGHALSTTPSDTVPD